MRRRAGARGGGTRRAIVLLLALVALPALVHAATRYVSLAGGHVPPFISWADAATNIQDAVDVCDAGDVVLVTNGVYGTGGRVVYGELTNRVAVTNAIVIQGVNGPEVTVIAGAADSSGGNGDAAVRCVWLGANASLSGFTLTNGHTRATGDLDQEQGGGGVWCESTSVVISNCVLIANSAAAFGGGACRGTWRGCSLLANSVNAPWGCQAQGGGAYRSVLEHCSLVSNAVHAGGTYAYGGGANESALDTCSLVGNAINNPGGWAFGGGANESTLRNCLLTGNASGVGGAGSGGGAASSSLDNCTLSDNSASYSGGGIYQGTLNNSIVYFNAAPSGSNYDGSVLNYCCSSPAPGSGSGNFGGDPVLADRARSDYRLGAGSPCINAGVDTFPVGPEDLDGRPRVVGAAVDLGAYEYPLPTFRFETAASPSPHGATVPFGYGIRHLDPGSTLTNSVETPVGEISGTRWSCIGWSGTGSVPPSGETNLVTFAIQQDSTLTWLWQFQHFLEIMVNGSGAVDTASGWYPEGTLNITAIPDAYHVFVQWTGGDLPPHLRTANPLSIILDRPFSLTAEFQPVMVDLTVEATPSRHGYPTPWGYGNVSLQAGSTVTNSVDSPTEEISGTRWRCTGWTATGSLSPSGATNEISCTITQSTTLTWQWLIEHFLDITVSGSGTVDTVAGWYPEGVMYLTAYPATNFHFTHWSGDVPPGYERYNPLPLPFGEPRAVTAHLTDDEDGDGLPDGWELLHFGDKTNAVASADDDGDGLQNLQEFVLRTDPLDGQDPEITVHYVLAGNAGAQPPYTNTETAAANIQDAVDYSCHGDTVLVGPGVYDAGGRAIRGDMTNRVALYKAITVQSTAGPGSTIIEGQGPVGDTAIRCAYVTNAAVLSGFTLTNGATWARGDPYNEGSGGGVWCEPSAIITNCVLAGNTAFHSGGGAFQGLLFNCTLAGNSAASGGGSCMATLEKCVVSNNRAATGGGTEGGAIRTSTIVSNRADIGGGGCLAGEIDTCFVVGNTADSNYSTGGGVWGCTVRNCTIVHNGAATGAGAFDSTVANSIILYNYSGPVIANHSFGSFTNCCTVPLPGGVGNTDEDPRMASGFSPHLTLGSPCIDAGSAAFASGTEDIDGDPRVCGATVDIGCDEFCAPAVTGVLQLSFRPGYATAAVGTPLRFELLTEGSVLGYEWVWGDGSTSDAGFLAEHAYASTGRFQVVVWASNLTLTVATTTTVTIVQATTNYASLTGGNVSPYTSWATAARCIQDAVDAAPDVPGAVVMVDKGTYADGQRAQVGSNRICVLKPLVLAAKSSDPAETVIDGRGSVRCVYLGAGAVLSGFTLTNGYAAYSSVVSINKGGGIFCEDGCLVTNCIIAGNAAQYPGKGGGAFFGHLVDCVIRANRGEEGGGTYGSIVDKSRIVGNGLQESEEYSGSRGGGSYGGVLRNCDVAENLGTQGGGIYDANALNCDISRNAALLGGGTYRGSVQGCFVHDNSAEEGGGSYASRLYNCTVVHNLAMTGGGVCNSYACNSIIYGNSALKAGSNYAGLIEFDSTCSMPLAPGMGNITNPPVLVSTDNPHLLFTSPCIDSGRNDVATPGTDFDGEPRIAGPAVDMGCDEFSPQTGGGALGVHVDPSVSYALVGVPTRFVAVIDGQPASAEWQMGDGTLWTNRNPVVHAYMSTGSYEVTCRAWYGDSSAIGTARVWVVAGLTNFVDGAGSHVWPFDTWAKAAATIQDAIDAAPEGGTVLVRPGVYNTQSYDGGALSARVGLYKAVQVRATASDRAQTVIEGRSPPGPDGLRCAYVSDGALLTGFTLRDGSGTSPGEYIRARSGGGAWCESGGVISNCVVVSNSVDAYGGGVFGGTLWGSTVADNTASKGGGVALCSVHDCEVSGNRGSPYGGGLYECTVEKSTIAGNHASLYGGGIFEGTLYSCLLIGNTASSGGGSWDCTLYNSTVSGNSGEALRGGMAQNCIIYYNYGGTVGATLNACCTPEWSGAGTITNDPQFVDLASGDFHLKLTSPCINKGVNQGWMFASTERDGKSRIRNGTVDMGAYEATFVARLRLWLTGPYDTNTHTMTSSLGTNLSLRAPYAVDTQRATALPFNSTDWVLLELQGTNYHTEAAQGAWLRNDGYLLSEGGSTGVEVDVSQGASLYLVVKHRNHWAAMSAQPLSFTNVVTSYDFTGSPLSFFGGATNAVEVEPGVWAMRPGDVDGDGEVGPADLQIGRTQEGKH